MTDLTENNHDWLEKMNDLREHFIKEMDDDFNTANGNFRAFRTFQAGKSLFD